MTRQLFGAAIVVAAVIAAVVANPQAQQARKPVAASKHVTGWIKTSTFVPPKTPWGDPDIQGGYSNVNENGIPFEKPGNLSTQAGGEVDGVRLGAVDGHLENGAVGDGLDSIRHINAPRAGG